MHDINNMSNNRNVICALLGGCSGYVGLLGAFGGGGTAFVSKAMITRALAETTWCGSAKAAAAAAATAPSPLPPPPPFSEDVDALELQLELQLDALEHKHKHTLGADDNNKKLSPPAKISQVLAIV